jgi:inhibitor of cysteine peptidase
MFRLSDFRFPTLGKGLFLKGLATFLIGITLSMALLNLVGLPSIIIPGSGPSGDSALLRFNSYNDLTSFLNRTVSSGYNYYAERGITTWSGSPLPSNALSGDVKAQSTPDYSKTNIQVAGVDEADIVKTDGTYIYLASKGQVFIIRTNSTEIVASIPLNGSITGIFVNGNKLVVFEGENIVYLGVMKYYASYYGGQSSVKVYDISNKRNPILFRNISMNGSYFDSRMIGDYVYVLVTSPVYQMVRNVSLPSVRDNGKIESIQASSIYYSNVTDYSYSFTTILAFNVQDNKEIVHQTILSGYATSIYVSAGNIYLASPKYDYGYAEKTQIHRIKINTGEITYEASGEVLGYVLNQFSMDEYKGYFRLATTTTGYVPRGIIATTQEQTTSVSQVYVLNANMKMVGNLTGLAPGETIYSARFMGDRCYLVTFVKIDPLFVIDLKNPANPQVLGTLKIPGYSSYLQPYDDNHIIGIGKQTVESDSKDFAWYQGVKISLFDVKNVAKPQEVANATIGDRGTDSPALSDHKALLFDKTRNLLAIPVLVARINPAQYPGEIPAYAYGEPVWQGLYVYTITENTLTLKGTITHATAADFAKDGYYYYGSDYTIQRSLYIGNVLYTISNRMIKMNSLTDLAEIGQIKLPSV